jgi:hypothetical protein
LIATLCLFISDFYGNHPVHDDFLGKYVLTGKLIQLSLTIQALNSTALFLLI